MKPTLSKLALTTAFTSLMLVPGLAQAMPVTLTTTLSNFPNRSAYLAIYVTDKKGVYQGSLWMAGGAARYYHYLKGWMRATRGNLGEINGITGASVGSGRTLKIQLDLPAAVFDAGYQLHIDAASEGMRESPNDVVVPLTTSGSGKAAKGRYFVKSFTYTK